MADEERQLTFSERIGITPVRTTLQLGSMDEALKNSLWNVLVEKIFEPYRKSSWAKGDSLVDSIWGDHLKRKLDVRGMYSHEVVTSIRSHFDACSWNKVYELIEFLVQLEEARFRPAFNRILARELSGYRFVGKKLVPIVAEVEIAAIETALVQADKYRPVNVHLSSALEKLADRESPDYRNSIKESISAVEAMCRIVTGDDKATLGQAVKKLEDSGVKLHTAFREALSKMYGYTSDAEGIRHALLEESTLDADDARFMLVSCSAFVNYLKAKWGKGN